MIMWNVWLVFLLCYVLGNLSFGLLLNWATSTIDLRAEGSGNVGASNVWRIRGAFLGFLTLCGDALKGVCAVFLAKWLVPSFLSICVGSLAVVLGHVYPVFLKFRGGKGVATAFGVLTTWCWPLGVMLALCWVVILRFTGIAFLASMVVSVMAPFLFAFMYDVLVGFWVGLLSVVVIWAHRDNWRRFRQGREHTFRFVV